MKTQEPRRSVPFHVWQAKNRRATVVLVAFFIGLVGFMGYWLGLLIFWSTAGSIAACVTALLLSGLWFVVSYYSGGYMVLGIHRARPAHPERERQLYNVVEEMAIAAGTPTPLVYVMPSQALNAFATGRSPEHSMVAVTSGLLEKLSRDELQGVVAHEMSHIRNYDIRLMMLVATLVGAVVVISEVMWRVGRVVAMSGGRSRGRGGGGAAVLVIVVVSAILAAVAPMIARIIQFAISRRREYLADASGVELTRYPQGLANALEKIAFGPKWRLASRSTQHTYIHNPFMGLRGGLFATHPPIGERIRRLRAM